MKNVSLVVLISIGLAFGAVVLAACDRTTDEVNPDPISDGAFGPGTAWSNLMGTGGSIEPPDEEGGDDTISEPDAVTDLDVEDDAGDVVNECTGSATYCSCFQSKGNDSKYEDYCNCIDSLNVPGGDNATYCGCCFFAYDPTFPEYDDEWKFLVVGTCDPNGYSPPCEFD